MPHRDAKNGGSRKSSLGSSAKSADEPSKKAKHPTKSDSAPQGTVAGEDKAAKVHHGRRLSGHGTRRKSTSEMESSKQPNNDTTRRRSITEIVGLHHRKRRSLTDVEAGRRKSISDAHFRRRKSLTENDILSRPALKSTWGQDGGTSKMVPSASEEAPATRSREQLVVAVAVFVSVLMACVIAFLLFFGHVKTVGYCTKDACIEHAKRLSATINTSRDPCVDFYAFVCGGWQKDFPAVSVQGKLNEDAMKDEIRELERDIWSVGRASRLYNKCLDPQQSDIYQNILWLTGFMRAVNLAWPSRHPDVAKTRPLAVMINMSANYDLNFLFRLEAVSNTSTGNVLIFRRCYNGIAWSDRLRKPMTLVDYARSASEQIRALRLTEYVDYDASLLQKLEKSFTDANDHATHGEQAWFVIGDLDTRTVNIEPGQWLHGLNDAYGSQNLTWVSDNFAVFEDSEMLTRIDALFRDYNEVQLSIGIAWMFIQSHVWVAIGKPGLMFHDNVEEKRQLACLEYVSARFGLLASVERLSHLYPTSDARREVTRFVGTIRDQFNIIMKGTRWIDREIRETAGRKIDRMLLNTLPPEQFFLPPQRATLYEKFPAVHQAPFMEVWLNTSRVYQSLQVDQRFRDVYKKQRTFRRQAYEYTYLLNTVDSALAALEPPLYYPGGTFAMNYATAGTLILREMVKSIDPGGTSIDDRGESIHWWGKSESAQYNRRLNCDLGRESDERAIGVIPVVPALELSYTAFKAAAEKEASTAEGVEDLRLRGLDDFVDEQIFFMSYCYALCGKEDDANMRRECNVPLRHSSFFVDAFQCPQGSPMNLATKCTFFF